MKDDAIDRKAACTQEVALLPLDVADEVVRLGSGAHARSATVRWSASRWIPERCAGVSAAKAPPSRA